jgi:hypothetical protein
MKFVVVFTMLLFVGCTAASRPTAGGPGATDCSVKALNGACEAHCEQGKYAECDARVSPPKCECKPQAK